MRLLTNPFVVMIKLRATKCCFRLYTFVLGVMFYVAWSWKLMIKIRNFCDAASVKIKIILKKDSR